MEQGVGLQQTPVPMAAPQPWMVWPVARSMTLVAQTAPGGASVQSALVVQGESVQLSLGPLLHRRPPSAKVKHLLQVAGHVPAQLSHAWKSQQTPVPTGTPQPCEVVLVVRSVTLITQACVNGASTPQSLTKRHGVSVQ
jgi:hypothetical protein